MSTTHTINISTTGAGRNRIPTGTHMSRLSTPTRIIPMFIIDMIADVDKVRGRSTHDKAGRYRCAAIWRL